VAEIAGQAGIADYHARLRPEDKMALVRAREAAGETVLMVGDGINDAPVLAAASVSIAMGAGASLAQTSAGAVLMTADLDVIPSAVETARRTVGVIRQNLGWAVVYNVLALPLAALGYIPPWAAAIGMSTSSLLVVANALRLRSGAAAQRPVPAMTPRATGSPA
jgi:Cu2+-exporting ATPase